MTRIVYRLVLLVVAGLCAALALTLFAVRAQTPRWIAYVVSPLNGSVAADLFVQDVATGKQFNLTHSTALTETSPAWSPDGEMIAYTQSNNNGQHLCVLRLEGAEHCFPSFGRWDSNPVFSPDSARLLFSSPRDFAAHNTFLLDVTGGAIRELPLTTDSNFRPVWSPDGARIAVMISDVISSQIVVTDSSGQHPVQVTSSSPGGNWNPVWSPDGSTIAFVSGRAGPTNIYLVSPDGGAERPLTDRPGSEYGIAWSPDSMQLVFSSDRNGGDLDLYVIDTDGANLRALTDNSAMEDGAAWSPDGTEIAFRSDMDGANNLYLLNVATGAIRRLTDGNQFYNPPVWRPQ